MKTIQAVVVYDDVFEKIIGCDLCVFDGDRFVGLIEMPIADRQYSHANFLEFHLTGKIPASKLQQFLKAKRKARLINIK